MEQLTKIAELLGEDNVKRLQDTITDMIIENVKSDMDDMNVYLIDFEAIMDGVRRDIERDVRERLVNEYVEVLRKRLDDYFSVYPCGIPTTPPMVDIEEFNKNMISEEYLEQCGKAGELFANSRDINEADRRHRGAQQKVWRSKNGGDEVRYE